MLAHPACTSIKQSQNARLHNTSYAVSYLFTMKIMTVKEPHNVLLLHFMRYCI